MITQQTTSSITIIAESLEEVMAQFRQRCLADAGYVITGPAVRQHFALRGEPLFAGTPMVAATFARRD